MTEALCDELKRFVGFCEADEAALRALLPLARPRFRSIVDEFYRRMSAHEGARSLLTSPAHIDRLKETLVVWLDELFSGPWDEAYCEKRARIGRVHVRVGVEQRYVVLGMNHMRSSLLAGCRQLPEETTRERAAAAVTNLLDLELTVMLETYRDGFSDAQKRSERQEKTRLAKELALAEARYQEVIDHAWSLVTTFDEHGTVLMFNTRSELVTGLSRAQAIGRNWAEIFLAEEARADIERTWQRVIAGETGDPHEGPLPGPNGRRVRWHFTTLPSGAGPLLCAIGSDVTDERDLQARARQTERLASLGIMAAGLAHEIRNPINSASLQLVVAGRRASRVPFDSAAVHQAIQLADNEMHRAAQLLSEFLEFARPMPIHPSWTDLSKVLSEISPVLSTEAEAAGVALRVRCDGDNGASLDGDRIKQLVHNLVRNAIEAVGSGGHVEVRSQQKGREVLLEVEDDGPGLAAPAITVFEPFFTTKPSGTGLGLSIVHRIVSDHGGTIQVKSRPGQTVFAVSLPKGQ